jgi:hypothetical protein
MDTAQACTHRIPWRILAPNKDYLENLWSFAPAAIKSTSSKLAALTPDTAITAVSTGFRSLGNKPSFEGYRILKLPACSDKSCAAAVKTDTSPSVLRGGNSWNGNYGGMITSDDMIVFNVS